MIKNGSQVTLEFSVFVDNKIEVESNKGQDPLIFTQGEGQIMPAVEAAVEGMKTGGDKTITVLPEQAYGPVHDDAFKEVPIELIPEGYRVVGAILGFQDDNGESHQVRVHQIEEDLAVLDLNHPLAGKILEIELIVIAVE